MADLDGMALFLRVIEAGSLSAASRALGLPKSTVSRRLAHHEAALGTPLVHRSTRALSLTDAGKTYLERVRPIVREAEAAELEIKGRGAKPVGLVRISATSAFGQSILSPILCDLMGREPGLRIDLRLAEQRLSIFTDNLDVAVRMGALDDSNLVARSLCKVSRILVAAPSYLERRRTLGSPRDLNENECIVVSPDLDRWVFADGRELRVPWRFAAGSVLMSVDAALTGRGIALVPKFAVAAALKEGRLEAVLPQHPLPPAQATALYPRDRVPSIATKRVVDTLITELAGKQF